MTNPNDTPSAVFDFFDYQRERDRLRKMMTRYNKTIEWCKVFAETYGEDFRREGLYISLDGTTVWVLSKANDAWGFGKFKDFIEIFASVALGSPPDSPPSFGGGINITKPAWLSADWCVTEDRPQVRILITNVIATGCVAETKMVEQVTWKCGGES